MRFPTAAISRCSALVATFALAACGSSGSGMQNSASAYSQASNPLPRMVTLSQNMKMEFIPSNDRSAPPAGAPSILNAWISLSLAVSGTPCVNCVGNPPVNDSLGVAFPEPYLPLKSTFELTYTFDNVREGSSPCNLSFSFKQGSTVLFHHVYAITLSGNGQYVYFVATAVPGTAKAGAALVSAGLKCGSYTSKNATQTVYLH